MSKIFEWVSSNAIIPILWSLFGMTVVGFATFQTFWDVSQINTAVASALGIVYGIPAIAIGVWQWRSGQPAKKDKRDAVQ